MLRILHDQSHSNSLQTTVPNIICNTKWAPVYAQNISSQSHVMTDGQLDSQSVFSHMWGPSAGLRYCQTVAVLLSWGALSHEGMDLSCITVMASTTCHLHLTTNTKQSQTRNTDRKIPDTCAVLHIMKCPKACENLPEYYLTPSIRN
jgi:hypothetical protein